MLKTTSADGSDFNPIELTAITSKNTRTPSGTEIITEFVPVTFTVLVLPTLDSPYLTECAVTDESVEGSHVTLTVADDAVNIAKANRMERMDFISVCRFVPNSTLLIDDVV